MKIYYILLTICWFRISLFNILFDHLLPSVFWIFVKLCGILNILIITINLHLRICVLVFLVRLNVWLNKVRNNIQIFRLIFLRIFNCNMTFSFKMTPILLKIVLILMDRLRIDIWISQNTLRVKLVVLVRAYRHLLFNTILHLTLEPWFSIWIFLVHRCFFETILS